VGAAGAKLKGQEVMKYTLVYGGIAGVIVISIACLVVALDLPSHFETPWFGYLVMLVALSLIFVGVKRFRDIECGGVITFRRGFALGLGMAVAAAAIYVLGWEIFLGVTGRDFMAEYTASTLDAMRANGAAPAAIEAKAAEMRDFAVSYRNPLVRIPVTSVEIFPVGLIVALVSAALLRNPKLLAIPRRSVG
jgi:hypothetical protein